MHIRPGMSVKHFKVCVDKDIDDNAIAQHYVNILDKP